MADSAEDLLQQFGVTGIHQLRDAAAEIAHEAYYMDRFGYLGGMDNFHVPFLRRLTDR